MPDTSYEDVRLCPQAIGSTEGLNGGTTWQDLGFKCNADALKVLQPPRCCFPLIINQMSNPHFSSAGSSVPPFPPRSCGALSQTFPGQSTTRLPTRCSRSPRPPSCPQPTLAALATPNSLPLPTMPSNEDTVQSSKDPSSLSDLPVIAMSRASSGKCFLARGLHV